MDAGAAALEGEAVRLALRQAALQRWWRLPSAAWAATGVAVGDPGVVVFMVATPRPDLETLLELAVLPSGCLGDPWVTWMSCRVKAPRFSADDGDAYGYCIPLGGVIVGLLSVSGFRVKTLVRFFGLGGGGAMRRYPPEGVVAEPRSLCNSEDACLPA